MMSECVFRCLWFWVVSLEGGGSLHDVESVSAFDNGMARPPAEPL